ncbi:MFS transporter [Bacillus massiliglaciei]|uniref:MFS transporter n=1 Tax=Bacillus massiliglaciei TaxID=1816693 RepID=UPI000AC7DDD9|nr:MFS transporter [Bacillus massiliglaciei]
MKKEKLWTKDFIIVSVITFFLTLSMYLLLVTMAPYASKHFQASTSTAGLIASIFIIGSLVGRLAAGRISELFNNKKILLVGLSCNVLITALYFGASTVPLLITVRLLHGIAIGMASTITGAIIANIIPANRKGEGIGYFSLSIVMSTAVGPLVGILLSQYTTYSTIFVFSIVLAAISLAISFVVRVPKIEKPESAKKEMVSKRFSLANYFEYRAIPIAIVMLVAAFAYSGILSFLTVYAEEIDLVEASSFYFLVYAIVILLSRPFTGRLMDIKGANIVAYPALIFFAIGMFVFSQANYGWVLLAAGAIIGLGYGNFQSCAQALAIKVTPSHRMGLATSTYFVFLDLGLGLGPYLLGFFVPLIGYRGLFETMSAVIVISVILYFFLHGRKDKELSKSLLLKQQS